MLYRMFVAATVVVITALPAMADCLPGFMVCDAAWPSDTTDCSPWADGQHEDCFDCYDHCVATCGSAIPAGEGCSLEWTRCAGCCLDKWIDCALIPLDSPIRDIIHIIGVDRAIVLGLG